MSAPTQARVTLGPQNYRCDIEAGGHRLSVDEPASVGGQDVGPNPYELLAASLGSCTAITLRMYAERKQWPLDRIEVSVTLDRIHARDCEDCESEDGWVDRFVKRVSLAGNLSDAQRQRLLEISARCPVQRTLLSETRIESELA